MPAQVIIVFGRGLDPSGRALSPASLARVSALLEYLGRNLEHYRSAPALVVFSGGWAGASEGIVDPPPVELREGSLMYARAVALGVGPEPLTRVATCHREIDSDSVLGNLLAVRSLGCLRGLRLTGHDPLGVVAHREHLPRIMFLTRKVLGVPRSAVEPIPVEDLDEQATLVGERLLWLGTRVVFLGARSERALRSRERWARRGVAVLTRRRRSILTRIRS